jgi:hypothetical protein
MLSGMQERKAPTIYEGAPHGLPVTDKERFTQDVLAFVRG